MKAQDEYRVPSWSGLEQLEQRWLLSVVIKLDPLATPIERDVASTAIELPQSTNQLGVTSNLQPDITMMNWNGHRDHAVTDQWIVRYLDEPAELSAKLKHDGAQLRSLGLPGFGLLTAPFDQASSINSWVDQHEQLLYVEPDFLLHTQDTIPNDQSFETLWGLNNTGQSGGTVDADIDAPAAWDIITGSSNVVIAVIDTGIDYNHVDLEANIWSNPGEIPGDGVDNDGNGFIDDVHGWDFSNDDSDPRDDAGHGSHVAGTIGATGNNGIGVTGVNWEVQLMALKFLDEKGSGSLSDAILAINYATMMKRDFGINVRATNNSWGGGGFSNSLRDAILASAAEDILFVVAAGNGGDDGVGDNVDVSPSYPPSFDLDNMISVAATDRRDRLASFSNYGATKIDLGAPGVSILSTVPNDKYRQLRGTSMATPQVAGVVALLASAFPSSTGAEIKTAILKGVDPIPALTGKTVTGGRLNALGALHGITRPTELSGSVWHDVDSDGERDPTESGLTDWTVFLDLNNNGKLDQSSQIVSSGDVPKVIGDVLPNTITSDLVVSDLTSWTSDVNVMLDINHTWDADLEVFISDPRGARVLLFSGVGGSGDDFDDTSLDDEAQPLITSGSAPFSGTYRPQGSLTAYDTHDPNGLWSLQVVDRGNFDGGSLNSWSLQLTTTEPFTTTDVNGDYAFTGISAGDYTVTQVVQDGFQFTFPASETYTISLGDGQIIQGLDFANVLGPIEPTAIGGVKWHDLDADGFHDADEPGLKDWTIFLDLDQNGQLDINEPTATTNEDGSFLFVDVVPDNYTVAELIQPGWQQTFPGTFRNGGFEDGDVNGWETIGSAGVVDSAFGSGPNEGNFQALLTNGGGSASDSAIESFLGLAPGVLDSALDDDVSEGSAIRRAITVEAGTVLTFEWNFLTNESTPDPNFNDLAFTTIVPGPPGASIGVGNDVVVLLADTNSSFSTSATLFSEETSYRTGSHTFDESGVFTIGLGVMDGGDPQFDSGLLLDNFDVSTGRATHNVTIAAGRFATDVNFGNHALPSEIRGRKWNDLDSNGLFEPEKDEFPLKNWTIFLDLNHNGVLDSSDVSTVTNEVGEYAFLNLLPDTYRVAEVLPPEWRQTLPGPNAQVIESIAGGGPSNAVDFNLMDATANLSSQGTNDVDITVEVAWRDSCGSLLPNSTIHSVNGNQITLRLFGQQIGEICLDVVTPESQTVSLGELDAGLYSVTATLHEEDENPFIPPLRVDGTIQVSDSDPHTIDVGPDQVINNVDFGNRSVATFRPRVFGRHIFYNNSAFDGNDPAANANDDNAIAPDPTQASNPSLGKSALSPGQTATIQNYTNYSRGINGIMIDIDNLPDTNNLSATDFEFHVGNDRMPDTWDEAPAPADVTVRQGAGVDGTDRITIVWPDNVMEKEWLEVTIEATPNTGLEQPDVFYFGNAIGESGDQSGSIQVNAADELNARFEQHNFINPAPIDDPVDFNRDRLVNATDELIARFNGTSVLTALELISIPLGSLEQSVALSSRSPIESDDAATSQQSLAIPITSRSNPLRSRRSIRWPLEATWHRSESRWSHEITWMDWMTWGDMLDAEENLFGSGR